MEDFCILLPYFCMEETATEKPLFPGEAISAIRALDFTNQTDQASILLLCHLPALCLKNDFTSLSLSFFTGESV